MTVTVDYTCRCGQRVKTLFRGRGCLHALWYGGLGLGTTLLIYVTAIALALAMPEPFPPAARAVLAAIPVVIYAVTLMALAIARHRAWCLIRRSLYWFLVWPGVAIMMLMN